MDKIEQIHIARVPFSIEVGAQTLLKEYLHDIRSNLDTDTADEVIGDIESRIPELLAERKVKRGDVITKSDVSEIRKQLGEPEQFSNGEPAVSNEGQAKKLFRDPDGALVAGVASGIGNYLNVDANLVRIGFFVAMFFGGFGIVLYLFLWFLLPEAKSSADKLLMSGMPVTIASLQHYQASVQQRLKNGPKIAQLIIIGIVKITVVTISVLTAVSLLITLGLLTGLLFVDPFHAVVTSYGTDYVLVGLLWLVCLSFIGLIAMLIFSVTGHHSTKIKVASLFTAVTLIAALSALGATGVMVASHFTNEYGNGKANAALAVNNESQGLVPTDLVIKSDQYLSVNYVIAAGPIHATYVALPDLSRPDIHVTNSNGVITIDSGALDQSAPSCLGGLCRKIYLPIRMTLYGPALKQITNSNGGTLWLDNANLGSNLSLIASNNSTINLNNSTGTDLTITATNGAAVSANNSSVTNANVTVDSTSMVNAPTTNILTATLPTSCDQSGNQVLSINGASQTLINGQTQSSSELQNNDCINFGSGPGVPPAPVAN